MVRGRRGNATGTAREEKAEDTGLVVRWTLSGYHRECAEVMDAGRFRAMAVIDKNLVLNGQNNF